jgi:hypothetical protein
LGAQQTIEKRRRIFRIAVYIKRARRHTLTRLHACGGEKRGVCAIIPEKPRASIEESAAYCDVRDDWLAQAYRLAHRSDAGLPENDKQRRFLSKREVFWGMSA